MTASLFGPVTDVDLRRWQRRNYLLLGKLLDRDLPVIDWTVTPHTLLGRCSDTDPARRREAFQQWVTALCLDRWCDRVSPGGTVHLHAVTQNWDGTGVTIGVIADILED
jgi:hypothetical protein